MDQSTPKVIIVGAGAVGLTLANLLGHRGITTVVLEKQRQRKIGSRAIGITPPTLELLAQLKLDQRFIADGVKVEEAEVFGSQACLGTVPLNRVKGPYPFILTLPQRQSEALLEEHLDHYPCVTLKRGVEVTALVDYRERVVLKAVSPDHSKEVAYDAEFLCACDGKNSFIRQQLAIPFIGAPYPQTYLMADFKDNGDLGSKARFYFTDQGPVETFPLPGELRRWLIDTPWFMENAEPGYLEKQVQARTGVSLSRADKVWETAFGVQHYLARQYGKGRVLLCGDAAHIMSPIGGLGMNVGMMDAAACAGLLAQAQPRQGLLARALKTYERCGQKAAKAAIRESAFNTYWGSIKNKLVARLRAPLIKAAVRWGSGRLAAHYAMQTIPRYRDER